jgi:hypothetical protein
MVPFLPILGWDIGSRLQFGGRPNQTTGLKRTSTGVNQMIQPSYSFVPGFVPRIHADPANKVPLGVGCPQIKVRGLKARGSSLAMNEE